jgi:hypothetical protein
LRTTPPNDDVAAVATAGVIASNDSQIALAARWATYAS